ncbi:Bug family tripartite tricarboxylate transporter substrate binding protein [Polaromonas eurypsychrophila]|uniref:MFS transporter n=1 Tax=Polaromonas eurypsychrophila TaxID=1614635 RepID=A0A916WHP4_9BURK|nr:tripartite tricarboxylate transporter substrate binding protein [Polaromonas eurypsychrophila]GGA98118.1 MFS transporter [Polaromonas eurypsychrophila]
MPSKRFLLKSATAVALSSMLALSASGAAAQERFPSKPVSLVVPFAAGGATDAIARLIGQKLGERWGQPVVVDNRAGATGAIGSTYVARAPADGYTLLLATASTHSVAPAVNPKLSYSQKDFSTISLVATFPNMLVVHPSVPARNVAEFVALLKAEPSKYNFASTGAGGSVHLAAELFKIATGTEMVHVPFKGSGAALSELLSGRVQIAFDNIPAVWPQVQQGKLRALAVTGLERSPVAPEVPTLAETVPGFSATTWVGLMAPAGLPPAIAAKIAADTREVMQLPEVKKKLLEQGASAVGSTPEQFSRFVAEDTDKWRKVVRVTGFVME